MTIELIEIHEANHIQLSENWDVEFFQIVPNEDDKYFFAVYDWNEAEYQLGVFDSKNLEITSQALNVDTWQKGAYKLQYTEEGKNEIIFRKSDGTLEIYSFSEGAVELAASSINTCLDVISFENDAILAWAKDDISGRQADTSFQLVSFLNDDNGQINEISRSVELPLHKYLREHMSALPISDNLFVPYSNYNTANGAGLDVYFSIFSAGLELINGPTLAHEYRLEGQDFYSATVLNEDSIIIIYNDRSDLKLQAFDFDGQRLGSPITVAENVDNEANYYLNDTNRIIVGDEGFTIFYERDGELFLTKCTDRFDIEFSSKLSNDTGILRNYSIIDEGPTFSVVSAIGAGIDPISGLIDKTTTLSITEYAYNYLPQGSITMLGNFVDGETVSLNLASIADKDGLGNFSFQWLRDDSAISGATNSTYAITSDDVGAALRVSVSYTDGRGTLETVSSAASAAVAAANSSPTGQPIIEGTAAIGETLTVNTESITDDDGVGEFSYQWMKDGTTISGANSSTYLVSSDDGDSVLSVQISYTDQLGTVESLTSDNTSSIVSPHEYADNFTITSSFGTSVYEGTLSGAEEGSGNQISFTINQIDPPITLFYVALQPATGQTADFWDNLSSKSAHQFDLLATIPSVDGGAATITYTLNADSTVEEDETFAFNVYENRLDFALGGKAIKSFEFSVLDDDTTQTFTSDLYDRSGADISGFQLFTSSGSATETYVTNGTGMFEWSSTPGATVEFESATAFSNSSKAVTSADALDALKLSVGLTPSNGTPNAYDYIAADFNRDGKVTSSDALDILKYAVGLEVERDAEWVFIRSDEDLTAVGKNNVEYDAKILIEDITSDAEIGLIGILIGDVNDSYSGLVV